jgi:hypothetical protein
MFNGFIQNAAAMLAYFVIMNDYGFRPASLFYYTLKKGYIPLGNDVYNPYDDYKGNSIAFIADHSDLLGIYEETYEVMVNSRYSPINWVGETHVTIDQRVVFYDLSEEFWAPCAFDSRGMDYDGPVCWRVEALRHAQGGFLLAIIVAQIANGLIWRTKVSSIFKHKLTNMPLNFCYVIEFILIVLLLYVPGIYTAFAIRPLRVEHFMPAAGMSIVWFFYVEFTKFLVRNIKQPDGSPGFFYKAFNY